jgi:hypothetical protein
MHQRFRVLELASLASAEPDLVGALKEGRIAGAGLEVFENDL